KEQAEAEGLDKIFLKAGFEWREPGCSMCLAMNPDKLSPGERCASTSNRNFEGRQGYKGRTHLVSPAMPAAAAIPRHFVDVREGTWRALRAEVASRLPPAAHPGNDDRPARAIFCREPRGAFAHVPRPRVLVGVRHRVGRRVRPVGIGGSHANSRARAR